MVMKKIKNNKYYICLSLVIGDGYIQQRRNSNKAYLDIAHKCECADYIKYKSNVLSEIGIENHISIKHKQNGRHQCRVTTKSYKILHDIKNKFYKDKKRVFRRNWIDNLDEFSLAILWMDDGFINRQKKKLKNGNEYIYELGEIATYAYDFKSNENIVLWLRKFNIDAYICQKKNKSQYYIRMNRDNLKKLIKTVEKYVKEIPSMYYKINI